MRTDTTAALRVLVAAPHPCVRAGLRAILGSEPDLRVVGEAADAGAAAAMTAALIPDVVVLDVALPGLGGPHATARLLNGGAGRGGLMLTTCADPAVARQWVEAGARGYVRMTASPDELVRAARAVAGGGTFVDPELALAVLRPDGSVGPGDLSDREVGVLRLIAVGYSNKEIAARLGVSVKTVETYKSRAMEKLKCRGRVDIVRYAARCGWFADAELPPPEYADLRPTAGPVDEVEPAGARGSR